jgi:hypothetical protein
VAAPLPDIHTIVHALRDDNRNCSSTSGFGDPAKQASLRPIPPSPTRVGPIEVKQALSSA